MSESNHAYNIIMNLAYLPEFLRESILKQRVDEFFHMEDYEKFQIINNALEIGFTIPFIKFAKLFKTWLIVLANTTEKNRNDVFSKYIKIIIKKPCLIINFNLDGIFEVFKSLDESKKNTVIQSIKIIIKNLDSIDKKKIGFLIPDNIKNYLEL